MADYALRPSGFFVLRAPLLPFDEVLSLSDELEAPATATRGGDLGPAITADRDRARARLRLLAKRAQVGEAIFLASSDVADAVAKGAKDGPLDHALELTLLRYVL